MRAVADIAYSLQTLAASKGRTFLTMLGVIIGVASVIAVASVGASAQGLVVGQVATLGSNVIGVLPGASSGMGPPAAAFGIVTKTFTLEDVKALSALPHVEAGSGYVRSSQSVSMRNESVITLVNGVDAEVTEVEDFDVDDGRFISAQDVSGFGRVAVLGHAVAEKLSPYESPVGKTVRIKGIDYLVIGAVGERGTVFFQDQDDQVFIPVTTAQKLVTGTDYAHFGRFRTDDASSVAAVKEDFARTLRRRHNVPDPSKDDFSIRSTDQAIDILGNVTGAVSAFLLLVTAISLLVGGVNIMNIMYVAVRERTREVGLRKALGARPGRILSQFLVESAVISFIGGFIGVILGFGIAYGASFAVKALGFDWEYAMPVAPAVAALAVSTAIGLAFGIAPAMTASRLDPIESLRYE